MGTRTRRLLRNVALRRQLSCFGAQFYWSFLALAAVYAALLSCSRLLGLLPDVFHPATPAAPVMVALGLALAIYRGTSRVGAARLVDTRIRTDDLFLTAVLIDSAAGVYKPIVLAQAEQRAAEIRPGEVAPFAWAAKARNVIGLLVLLLVGVLLLPQLDPFGRGEQRRREAERQKQLEDSRRATALRVAALTGEETASDLSGQVARAVGELKQTFNATKPKDKQANLRRLTASQGKLGALWRKAGEGKLKNAPRWTEQRQRFGDPAGQMTTQWRQEIQEGNCAGVKKEIAELRDAVKRLAETKDEAEKRELTERIGQRLQQLADLAEQGLDSGALNASLRRALEQLALAGTEGLSAEALEGLQESLDLTALELEAMAQSFRDLKALEDALRALQLAKVLNEAELLDGEACSGCQGMGDYAALYAKMMAGRCGKCGGLLGADGVCAACGGVGLGMRGPGIGTGGLAPETPGAVTDFTPEKSKSSLTAGKILVSLKTRGLSESGQAALEYQESLRAVKQGVSEAIIHEQVPPAYHDAIRSYFDAMEEDDGGAEAE